MGKLLRVLVIVFLVLSIGALVLGILLFNKRELLKGRTTKLEAALISLGATVEAEPGSLDRVPEYPARDLSPCTDELIDTPELSDFWDNYSNELEIADLATLNLSLLKKDLMTYYKRDAMGKIERDRTTGYKRTDGPGTMQGVIDDLQAKAEAQYNLLNETRQVLVSVRQELVSTITELNKRKGDLRTALNEIENLKAEIVRLKAEITSLKQRIGELEEETRMLQDQLAEEQLKVALLQEETAEKDLTIEQLKAENDKLRVSTDKVSTSAPGGAQPGAQPVQAIEPGAKGIVAAVNEDWRFVVIQLTEAFMRELLGDDLSAPVPAVELMIKRPGKKGEEIFVTKVRLLQIKRSEKLGIADVMTEWQQSPVEKEDVVFY